MVPNGRVPSGGVSVRECVNHSGSFQRQSSSVSSLTAGAAGFLNLSQSGGTFRSATRSEAIGDDAARATSQIKSPAGKQGFKAPREIETDTITAFSVKITPISFRCAHAFHASATSSGKTYLVTFHAKAT